VGDYELATPGTKVVFDSLPFEVREDTSIYGKLLDVNSAVSGGSGSVFNGIAAICLVLAFVCGALFAYFYFKG